MFTSAYQVHPTSYADLTLASAHARIDDLHRRAARLAPAVEESAAGSGCTDIRPKGPRQAKAWDMVAEALAWNMIADHAVLVAAADAAEAAGVAYTVGYDSNGGGGTRYWVRPEGGDEVAVSDRMFDAVQAYQAAGIPWTTTGGRVWPSGSSYDAECADCVANQPHTHGLCPEVCAANGRRCEAPAGHKGLHDFIGVPHPAESPFTVVGLWQDDDALG